MYSFVTKFIFLLIVLIAIIFFSALVRRWQHNLSADKLSAPLYVESSGAGDKNIIFLHGLTGSHTYWNSLRTKLNDNYRTIAIDLLGFGRSPWPAEPPTLEDHLSLISKTIDTVIPDKSFLLVGHSMGALLSLHYATSFPNRVTALLLLSVPIFHSKEDAMIKVGKTSPYMRAMAFNPVLAPVLCKIHEAIGPTLAGPIFRWLVPDLPSEIVDDATLHTWRSYKGAMNNVILKTKVAEIIPQISKLPIQIIHGSLDPEAEIADLQDLTKLGNVKLETVSGDHNFVLKSPEIIIKKIEEAFLQHRKN